MPRTKGSKNKPKTVTADFATQIAEKQSAKNEQSWMMMVPGVFGKKKKLKIHRRFY